jgi:heme exporter protein A
MLKALNLGCVRGDRRLFKGLNFELNTGELIELRGPNGTGKTSLLRILCGLAAPAEGEVRWQDQNIRALAEEYHSEIAYLAHQNGVKDELNALENLRISNALGGDPLRREEAQEFLVKVGLANYWHLPARLLSAGQRRRIGLARLSASKAKLWLLDEVLASLDDAAIELTREVVTDHLDGGGMAIIATHQELGLAAGQRLDLGS